MIPKLCTAAFISISVFVSCADMDNKEETDNYLSSPSTENQVLKTTVADTTVKNTTNIQAGNTTGNTTIIPKNNNINFNSSNNTGNLNPAHGLPGHRCDIAVGAPLNSKPVQASALPSVINTAPATVNLNTQPLIQKVVPGMNPSHGQPGHRCDISVGAPLNSKPTPIAPPTQTTITPASLTPVKADSSKN